MTQSSYPTMSKEEWVKFFDDGNVKDCPENPPCPLYLEDETGTVCCLTFLEGEEEETSFEELCCRIGILRGWVQSSPTSTRKEK